MKASLARTDGIFVSVTPKYDQDWRLYVTMSPDLCFAKRMPDVMPVGIELLAEGRSFYSPFESHLDEISPDGTFYCYMLVGRGFVEASSWGFRLNPEAPTTGDDQNKVRPAPTRPFDPSASPTLVASRTYGDGILVELSPRLLELSELYVTPDVPPNVKADKNNCPEPGQTFAPPPGMRYVDVLKRYFNGRSHFDTQAAYGIDLCYFVVSKRTGKVVSRATGFRPLP